MRCPACGRAMQEESFGPVAVDVCGCGGLWFDWAELAEVDEPHEGFGAALEKGLARPAGPQRAGPLRCTKCDVAMREHRYQNIPGVWIDECYGCAGFFLDAGELRAIRDWLGKKQEKGRKLDALLRRDPEYRREKLEMAMERDRVRALEITSRTLTQRVPQSTNALGALIELLIRRL